MKRVNVRIPGAPYDVIVGEGVLRSGNLRPLVKAGAHGIVISSEPVMRLHGAALLETLAGSGLEIRSVLALEDGERAKTVPQWQRSIRAMARAGLDRAGFVVAFGGGSVGDSAGFAAASYMRGIRVIQIPTTLLSMVDSSVGGKTGLNLVEGKNLVGAFHQPSLVLADLSFLRTLSAREFQSGVYEILKCGFLRSPALVKLVGRTQGLQKAGRNALERAIAEAVEIKAGIVERDERESGERVLLNLGHTLGHALEAATSYRIFTHGEAVGYGMEFAVDLSEELGVTSPSSAAKMRAAIESVGERTPLASTMARGAVQAVSSDKKREGARLQEILLKATGSPVIKSMDSAELGARIGRWLNHRAARRAKARS